MTESRVSTVGLLQTSLMSGTDKAYAILANRSVRFLLHGMIVAALLTVFGFRVSQQLHAEPPHDDAIAYMTMAYNLVNHGVLSLDRPPAELRPTSYRAPVYPAFAAMVLAASGEARGMDINEFLGKAPPSLILVQGLVILLTAILASGAVRQRTRSWLATYVTFFGIACLSTLHVFSGLLLAEPLAALLVTLLTLSLCAAVRTRKLYHFAIAGGLVGILAITRSAFFYMWPVVLLCFAYVGVVTANRQGLFPGSVVFMLLFATIAGSWMARNNHHFGEAHITERSGIALITRAEFNQMTVSEYFASFCYYSNCQPLQYLLRFFDPEDYRRFDQSQHDSFYMMGRHRREASLKKYDSTLEADAALRDEGMRLLFIEHPLRHIAATIPLAHRGMYIHRCGITIIVFASTFYLLWSSLRRRDADTLTLLMPLVFSFAFTSFLTMSINRFNVPIQPLLWIATGLVLARLASRARELVRPGASSAQHVRV